MGGVRSGNYYPNQGNTSNNAGVIYLGGSLSWPSANRRSPIAYTFWTCNVVPGSHVVSVQWMHDTPSGATVLARTLVILGQ